MPKRLCSIALAPHEKTIVAADKFGDVFSLPLHPSADYVAFKGSTVSLDGVFQPAASELTVHTKGNIQALRQQQARKKSTPQKDKPEFEHKLLLGHVSSLTDITIVTTETASQRRHFVLTADRDEHVRISRYPQTHIIHGYCLGFQDFVSKLSILPWATYLLVVGGGEPSLRVFHWQDGRLLSETMFDGILKEAIKGSIPPDEKDRSPNKIAVSGIWPLQTADALMLVALEGLPLLFSFSVKNNGSLEHKQTIQFDGNVLDVAIRPRDQPCAWVSLDYVHIPGSMTRQRPDSMGCEPLVHILLDETNLQWLQSDKKLPLDVDAIVSSKDVPNSTLEQPTRSSRAKGEYSFLGEFLYGLENLRKKRGFYEDVDESTEMNDESPLVGDLE
jgi:tRNA (guanine-N(7)-)-methyltransferase subunit TRM82